MPQEDFMNTRLIGAATLFAAGSLLSAGTPTLGATPVDSAGNNAELALAGCGSGSCGSKDGKTDEKAKDAKKGKKDGSCGKDKKKDGSCGKDHKKDGSCGKDKKAEPEKK
jgi:hypothetical protein